MDLGRDGMGDGGLLGLLAGVWRGRGAASRTDGAWSFMVATSVGWMTYTEAAELLLCPGPRSTGRQPIPAPQAAGRGQPSMMRTRARPFRISAWGFPRESRETVTRGLFVGERRGVPGGVVAGRKEPGAQQLCELPRLEIAVRRHQRQCVILQDQASPAKARSVGKGAGRTPSRRPSAASRRTARLEAFGLNA